MKPFQRIFAPALYHKYGMLWRSRTQSIRSIRESISNSFQKCSMSSDTFYTGATQQRSGRERPRYADDREIPVRWNRTASPAVHSLRDLLRQGKLSQEMGGSVHVNPMMLREACSCPRCVDPSDKQRTFAFTEIPPEINVQSCDVSSDGTYIISWDKDVPGFEGHISQYSPDQVQRLGLAYSPAIYNLCKRPKRLWSGSNFRISDSTVSFQNYMNDSRSLARILHLLWRDGLAFIDGVPEQESAVAQIAERIGPLRNTFYGQTWDVRSVPQAKNVAYTSKYLGFHMDLLYMNQPPQYQLLHCLQNTCTGGESRFADTLNAADVLLTHFGRASYDRLASHYVMYQYSNDGHFYSASKPVFAQRRLSSRPPHNFTNAQNGGLIRFLDRVFWSPPFVGKALPIMEHVAIRDTVASAKRFADILESDDFAVETKLPAGTCAIFDNLRVVHARNAFDMNSGRRWLRGAYLDDQDFNSRAIGLLDELPDIEGAETTRDR